MSQGQVDEGKARWLREERERLRCFGCTGDQTQFGWWGVTMYFFSVTTSVSGIGLDTTHSFSRTTSSRARETKKALNEFLFAVCGTCASASARQSGAQCCAREGLNSFCGRASPVPKEKRKTKKTSAGPLSEHNSAFDIRAVRERIEGDRAKDEEATRLKHSLRPSVARRGGEAGPAASPGPAPLPPRGEARDP